MAVSYTGSSDVRQRPDGSAEQLALGVVTFDPMSTYVSATVADGPSPSGMIEVSGSTLTQTITFSAPVRDPLLAVITLGDYYQTTTWTFDATPRVLSTGPGIVNMNGTLTASGQDLVGGEGNGVVQFSGTFTSLSFTATSSDNGVFTVGIRGRQ